MVCNLSFGLFDGTRIVGYVFAYVESESAVHQRAEEVIYLKEIALLPGYENYLRPMFLKLYEQWQAFTPGMSLEAHVLSESLEKWRRLVRLARYYGVTLTDTAEVRKPGRPPYQLLRLDVDRATQKLAEQPKPVSPKRWTFDKDIGVTVVSDPRQWLSLKVEWDEMVGRTEDGNVFQSFDYLWQWWKHYGFWNELRIVVIRDGDRVIGLVPLMMEYFPVFGRTMRKLMFVTSPMDMNRPKFIFAENAGRCLPAFLGWLRQHDGDWDILDIDEQRDTAMTEILRQEFATMRCLVAESETLCPYIELQGGWPGFLAGLSKKMRGNVNRLRRRLAEQGAVEVRRITSWPELDAAMDVHCEIESKSWKARKELDLSSDKSSYFFHKGLARVFGEEGAFELRILDCDGRPIASTYGIVRDGVFQSLKIAHDSKFDRFSPGTVLESHELESLFDKRVSRYEFMGSFLANKLRWTSTVHKTTNIHVYQRQPRLKLFFFTYFVFKRKVKALLKRTGQFERVDRFLGRFKKNPFPRY
jgi:CelD/BcsL family acetyltransferase involved in cellulose biosynthesis